ncbi:nucleoside-diphosphate sugar epimerase/dehydratase [Motilimonas sp. 1_MG-2023]|uniref:nucleoside-diphosphate sugar epimerase/dehydratase n=1 Tax=Motilimonas sp. 1_MG-2023 TaxID=3062672 RepID=UPI0026E1FF3A|nr:nucleoside-diphosphate sugar epimerase/dehydratase [Motilimonas sp. 1_MG-2023]MDO6528217.1 nucleoside-diphosphate sugar epimerase/dehydratase [Motilimonas sp. 1_MG-2023]
MPFHKLNISRKFKRLATIIYDALGIIASILIALFLRLDSAELTFSPGLPELASTLVTVTVSIFCFIRLGLYRAILRYMTINAITTLVAGITTSAIVLAASSYYFHSFIPRSVPVIYALVALIILGSPRLILRSLVHQRLQRYKPAIIIYGAGNAGYQLAHALFRGTDYRPAAFIDDDVKKHGITIHGLRVFPYSQLENLIATHCAVKVLLALGKTPRAERAKLIQTLESCSAEVLSMPSVEDITNGKANINDIQSIEIEDLLGRTPVPPSDDLLGRCISKKNVMVTGAGGSIGSELCRQIITQRPSKLILFELNEFSLYKIEQEISKYISVNGLDTKLHAVLGSVQRQKRLMIVMQKYHIDTVYHAAAYKHVPLVEDNVVEGVRNNVFGTWRCAEAAVSAGVKNFVLISTDKAVRPTNVMGASKRMAELVLQAMAPRSPSTFFCMVRFGNVLGSSGSVVPLFREQIKQGGPVTVTHPDIIRYFMTIPEAAQLVIQAGAMAKGGEVFVLNMGMPVRIIDLATRMIKLSGLTLRTEDDPFGDIEIKIIGLRPGEKLYEELLVGEDSHPTEHPSIMKADEEFLHWHDLLKIIEPLDIACSDYDEASIYEILFRAPTGYNTKSEPSQTPSHSLAS